MSSNPISCEGKSFDYKINYTCVFDPEQLWPFSLVKFTLYFGTSLALLYVIKLGSRKRMLIISPNEHSIYLETYCVISLNLIFWS